MSSLVYSLDHQDSKKIRFFLLQEMFEKHKCPPSLVQNSKGLYIYNELPIV